MEKIKKIFVTGDKHGADGVLNDMNARNFPSGLSLDKDDAVVFLGDFGLLWSDMEKRGDKKCLEWLSEMPWTSLVVDGNHENFDSLDALSEEERYGGPVGVFAPHVYHLKRGYVYNIGGLKCFVFGGGPSPDKKFRTPGLDWWSRELPDRDETERGFESLEACGWSVDHVFTHVAPSHALVAFKKVNPGVFRPEYDDFKDSTGEYLDILAQRLSFCSWHFGHYHHGSSFFEANAAGLFRGEYEKVRLLPSSPSLPSPKAREE